MREILINVEPKEKRIAILKDGRLDDFFIERLGRRTIVGNIYKGRIKSLVSSIGAAFVDIGEGENGFLYLNEIDRPLQTEEIEPTLQRAFTRKNPLTLAEDKDILVQVIKEPYAAKGPRLTTHITLPCRYLVLLPQERIFGISRKIEDEAERARLKDLLQRLDIPKGMGLIVRTAAWGKSIKEFMFDIEFLLRLWRRIKRKSLISSSPSLLYEEYDLTLRVLRDYLSEDIKRIVIDSKVEFRRVKKFIRANLPSLYPYLKLYLPKKVSLFEKEGVEEEIAKIYNNRVDLESGAYIIVEPTETLVLIDVNSGRFLSRKDKETVAFNINCEAAEEIARQLRLRDLGGIIVIDFIDMNKESHRQKLLSLFKFFLRRDRAKTEVLGISKLGLLQMTRQRTYASLEAMYYMQCPYCKGKGKVRSVETMAILAIKRIKDYLTRNRAEQTTVICHPEVIKFIKKDEKTIKQLERKFHTKIRLLPGYYSHVEDLKIT